MEVWQIVLGAVTLFAGGVAYLIRIERILTQLSTTVASFCAESSADRRSLWEAHTRLRSEHHEHGERLTKAETKIETHSHQVRRSTA